MLLLQSWMGTFPLNITTRTYCTKYLNKRILNCIQYLLLTIVELYKSLQVVFEMEKIHNNLYRKKSTKSKDLSPLQLRLNAAAERRSLLDRFRTSSLHPTAYPAILGGGFRVDAYRTTNTFYPAKSTSALSPNRAGPKTSPHRQQTTTMMSLIRSLSKSPARDKESEEPNLQESNKLKKTKLKQPFAKKVASMPTEPISEDIKPEMSPSIQDHLRNQVKKKPRRTLRILKPSDLVPPTCTGSTPTTMTNSKTTSSKIGDIITSTEKPIVSNIGPIRKPRCLSYPRVSSNVPKVSGKGLYLPSFDSLSDTHNKEVKKSFIVAPVHTFHRNSRKYLEEQKEKEIKSSILTKKKGRVVGTTDIAETLRQNEKVRGADNKDISLRRNQSFDNKSGKASEGSKPVLRSILRTNKSAESSSTFSSNSLTSQSSTSETEFGPNLPRSSSEHSLSDKSKSSHSNSSNTDGNEDNLPSDDKINVFPEGNANTKKHSDPVLMNLAEKHRGSESRTSVESTSSRKRRPGVRFGTVSALDVDPISPLPKISPQHKCPLVHFSTDDRPPGQMPDPYSGKKSLIKPSPEFNFSTNQGGTTSTQQKLQTISENGSSETRKSPVGQKIPSNTVPRSNAHTLENKNPSISSNIPHNSQTDNTSLPSSVTDMSTDSSMSELLTMLSSLSSQSRNTFSGHAAERESNIPYASEVSGSVNPQAIVKDTHHKPIFNYLPHHPHQPKYPQDVPGSSPQFQSTRPQMQSSFNTMGAQNAQFPPPGNASLPPTNYGGNVSFPNTNMPSGMFAGCIGQSPMQIGNPCDVGFAPYPNVPPLSGFPGNTVAASNMNSGNFMMNYNQMNQQQVFSPSNQLLSPQNDATLKNMCNTSTLQNPGGNVKLPSQHSVRFSDRLLSETNSCRDPSQCRDPLQCSTYGSVPSSMEYQPTSGEMGTSDNRNRALTNVCRRPLKRKLFPEGSQQTGVCCLKPRNSPEQLSRMFPGMPPGTLPNPPMEMQSSTALPAPGVTHGMPSGMTSGILPGMAQGYAGGLFPGMFPMFPGMYPGMFMYPGMPYSGMWRPGRGQPFGPGIPNPFSPTGSFMFPYFPYGMPMPNFPQIPWNFPMGVSSHPNFQGNFGVNASTSTRGTLQTPGEEQSNRQLSAPTSRTHSSVPNMQLDSDIAGASEFTNTMLPDDKCCLEQSILRKT